MTRKTYTAANRKAKAARRATRVARNFANRESRKWDAVEDVVEGAGALEDEESNEENELQLGVALSASTAPASPIPPSTPAKSKKKDADATGRADAIAELVEMQKETLATFSKLADVMIKTIPTSYMRNIIRSPYVNRPPNY